MLVKWKLLRVESEAFIHPQRRHPLRNILVNGERQAKEIMHLFSVVEVELENLHERKILRRFRSFGCASGYAFARLSTRKITLLSHVQPFVYGVCEYHDQ